ncbi:MAG: uridine kinase [Dehalococcoidia bacterium]|nr:uridine kinase [Dehalococcoidia bacterium]
MSSLIDLLARALHQPRDHSTLLVGLDGPGGAGKSTLAWALGSELPDGTVIHMDDFYLPSSDRSAVSPAEITVGLNFDLERLRRQVFSPLLADSRIRYQRYDWDADALAEWHTVVPGGTVLVEGVCSIAPKLAKLYDLRLWLDCPREVRLARGLARDGEEARDNWSHEWMPAEDDYIRSCRPMDCADFLLASMQPSKPDQAAPSASALVDIVFSRA